MGIGQPKNFGELPQRSLKLDSSKRGSLALLMELGKMNGGNGILKNLMNVKVIA